MKPYSVLLLYPEWFSDGPGDTYLAFVNAENPAKAKHKAQVEALRAQGGQVGLKAREFLVLLVCEGHVEDLK